MFSGMASLRLSSALWLTAMAANPLGAEIARAFGVEIGFGSWLIAASVPTLAAMALLPLLLYKLIAPEVTATPEAPAAARKALAALGPLTPAREDRRGHLRRHGGAVGRWRRRWGSTRRPSRFSGSACCSPPARSRCGDIAKEGDVLATFIWFAVLFTLSGQLNALGFMGFLGRRLAGAMGGLAPVGGRSDPGRRVRAAPLPLREPDGPPAGALRRVPRRRRQARRAGAAPLAFQLLFATNFFSAITPQGSSANLLFAGSGYLSQGELYRLGAITTAFNLLMYLVVGLPWLLLVAR